eukprot:Gb_23658 [translate_table: standard]
MRQCLTRFHEFATAMDMLIVDSRILLVDISDSLNFQFPFATLDLRGQGNHAKGMWPCIFTCTWLKRIDKELAYSSVCEINSPVE